MSEFAMPDHAVDKTTMLADDFLDLEKRLAVS